MHAIVAVLALTAGCGDDTSATDAGSDAAAVADAGPSCATNDDCDDGLACNGAEVCESGQCVDGTALDCDDGIACTTDRCSEDLRRCVNTAPDEDGDGIAAASCLDARGEPIGTDCDDADALAFPGATEVCDAVRDEDCNPATLGPDADADGYVDAVCCNGTVCGDDCNDAVASTHPEAAEVCNAIDDDCDASIDETVAQTVYRDADGDGYGAGDPQSGCGAVAGFSVYGNDCNDTPLAEVTDGVVSGLLQSPVLPEVCDGIDNDCSGTDDDNTVTANWYVDADGDGFGTPVSPTRSCSQPVGSYSLLGTDCNDTAAGVNPAQAERCNGTDDDCNGTADYVIAAGDLEDDDRDGVADTSCTPAGTDCDDLDGTSGPGSEELCDGRDNDCDGDVDEAVASYPYYRDADGDGYGSTTSGVVVGCVPVSGYVRRAGDCDDTSASRSPGVTEGCNGVDDDCDALVDEAPSSDACTTTPNSTNACVAGRCRATGCAEGFDDCDHRASTGCEADVTSDEANCGGCGLTCAGACVEGVCNVGLLAHYDAQTVSSLVTDGELGVLEWNDLAAARSLSPFTGRPTLTTIGGHTAVSFTDGSGMVSSSGFGVPQQLTVFVVMRWNGSNPWGNIAFHADRDYAWSIEQSSFLGANDVHFQSANDNAGVNVTLVPGQAYVLAAWTDGTTRFFEALDASGMVQSTSAAGNSISVEDYGQLYVGISDNYEVSLADVGELLYFDHVLSESERLAMRAYLASRWDIHP